MRSTVFVTTAVLILSLSIVARADDRDRYRHDDRYQDHDRYQQNDRYDDRYRGDSRRTEAIVREIEQTAAAMHREYERNNRRPDRDEARVAATLHELHEEAYELARGSRYSGNYRGGSRHDRGFDGLVRAFDEVAESLERIRPRPYVDRGMDRIWSLMSELDRYNGGRSDRYDRGWNNRGYRDHGSRDRYRH
jgi:NTP pyrophosphatase (non-canonical NTP hydrolase)